MKINRDAALQSRIVGKCQETGDSVPLIAGSKLVLLSSAECAWKLARMEVNSTGPFENPPLINFEPTIGMCRTELPVKAEFDFNGRIQRRVFLNQSLSIIPRGDVGRWSSPDPHRTLFVSLNNSLLHDIALDGRLSADNIQLPFAASMPDDCFIRGTMVSFYNEAKFEFRSGQLYGDALATALAAHLLSRYSLHTRKLTEPKGGLSSVALRNTTEYLNENYSRDISLTELSAQVFLSPYHFSRLFKRSTGMSPHQYLIHCRVQRARDLLLSCKTREASLKQVAREVGFWDACHLNRHFKRIYGISPSQLLK
jgi:AraC family transcriptional regulator